MTIGEYITVASFIICGITFVFKNYYVFQSNTEAIKSLNNTIKEMNWLINKISEKQGANEHRILILEEQTKSLKKDHKEISVRIKDLEKLR